MLYCVNVPPSTPPVGNSTPSVVLNSDLMASTSITISPSGVICGVTATVRPVSTSSISCWELLLFSVVPAKRETVAPTLMKAGCLSSVVIVGRLRIWARPFCLQGAKQG